MLILWCFLLLTHFFRHGHPLECNTTNAYIYKKDYTKCCKKCAPGERMEKGCTKDTETVCKPCGSDFYMNEFSREMECRRCTQCTREHMVYEMKCSKTDDAVCGCESGYQCSDKPCTNCEKIPTTMTTITTTTATTIATMKSPLISHTKKTEQPFSQDTVWITLSLCCVCILLTCFILISRTIPSHGWIMLATAACFWRSEKTSNKSSQCTVDEEVPMPVQEVCGHKEWQEEV